MCYNKATKQERKIILFDEEFSLQREFEAEAEENPYCVDVYLFEEGELVENGIPQF